MTAADRQRLYAFVSRLWVKEADAAFLATVRGPLGVALLGELGALDAIDADFVHLTVVDLVPYESFFVRPDAQLELGGANPVRAFFAAYGFEADLAAARALSPDHLGIELELMSELCRRESVALADGDDEAAASARHVQRELLTAHLLRWAPIYLLAARRNAHTALYREGADATLQLLFDDAERLACG